MNRIILLLYKTNVKHFYIIVTNVINKDQHIIYVFLVEVQLYFCKKPFHLCRLTSS